ncbi:M23 family metallopeptidase [Paenibacillus rigui]|uniref:Peptidase M23 n=1 Tax=Paenibacillus rigui TaxID=554312 RepID=A0A229UM48_9BACL|nr:M23 family metallopeptidase [Paenibacillus rigui]OXM84453.1 peptidase M23 [Paenibacillus rigui]
MRFKWLQNKLTFVIIPEANKSVMRLRMSRAALCAAMLAVLLVLGAAAYVYSVHFHTVLSTKLRESALQTHTNRLEQDLTSKNKTIEQLQNELFQLSKQAAEVRRKVEEMKKLEHELKKLSSPGSADSPELPAAAAVTTTLNDSHEAGAALGMGGPPHPVTEQQMKALSRMAHANYTSLQKEMTELEHHWVQSRQTIMKKREQALRRPGLWPTLSRTVTSPFGYRKDPFTNKLSFHRGIDIAGKMNDPVVAAAKGTVLTVGSDKFHGNHIILDHGNGLRTWYMHLNEAVIRQGEHVERGQLIGKLGTSGRSTGPHLHYEILLKGKSTNPAPYLPKPE